MDNEREEIERQLRALLALEAPLRVALGMPVVDENTMDLVIEVAIDRLNAQQAVVDAVKAYAPVEFQGRIYEKSDEWLAVLDALAAYEQAGEGE